MTTEELIERRRQQRLKNLELYNLALEKIKEVRMQEENSIKNKKEEETNKLLKEREHRINRFKRASEHKRNKKTIVQEEILGMTLDEHREIVNKRVQELKQEEVRLKNEIEKAIQDKRTKNKEKLKVKVKRDVKEDETHQPNLIQEKVNNWYEEFKRVADGRSGTDFYIWSKSEEGAPIFEKTVERYKQHLSKYNRRNEFIRKLREKLFKEYNINLI